MLPISATAIQKPVALVLAGPFNPVQGIARGPK